MPPIEADVSINSYAKCTHENVPQQNILNPHATRVKSEQKNDVKSELLEKVMSHSWREISFRKKKMLCDHN